MAYDENYSNPYEGGSSLVFNGVDLGKECDMFVLGKGVFGAPSRDVTQIHIPGRNGDILIDNVGWNNVDVTYPSCCILSNFRENIAKLREYLLANPGYHELIDPYNPDEVRYAEFRGPFTPEAFTPKGNNAGMFDLTFNCKPQRFLRESIVPRNYSLCPYERVDSTVNSNDYAYIVDNKVQYLSDAGTTYVWTFATDETITVSNGYFYKSNGTTVVYDGETEFKNGTVTIPLVDKNGTKYAGFKGEIHASKTSDFRMESSNAKKYRYEELMYFYYMENTTFCFPFYNKTAFDAYPIIRGSYKPAGTSDTVFSCGGSKISIKNSQLGYTTSTSVEVNFDGVNRVASTEGQYRGLVGDFLIIPGGTTSILKITNAASIRYTLRGVGYTSTNYFQIIPMFYRI